MKNGKSNNNLNNKIKINLKIMLEIKCLSHDAFVLCSGVTVMQSYN
jgi:hypothetical protein